jgi:hypothetical protein
MTPTTTPAQETIAAIARLLHHAARQAARDAAADGPGSVLQLRSLGILLAAYDAADLVPEHLDPYRPAPPQSDVTELLLAAQYLARQVPATPATAGFAVVVVALGDMVREMAP